MDYAAPLVEAVLERRVNRYAAECRIGDQLAYVHVPNSGRMGELLVPGAVCLLDPSRDPCRKTSHDLSIVQYLGRWVGVDSRTPPLLLAEALDDDVLPSWRGMRVIGREPAFGAGRLDLVVRAGEGDWLVETKSVNLVIGATAYFPDAPTVWGARHLSEMAEAAAMGNARLAVWFVIQRDDAESIRPHWDRDTVFAAALLAAQRAGVMVGACRCAVTHRGLRITEEIAVNLRRPDPGWRVPES